MTSVTTGSTALDGSSQMCSPGSSVDTDGNQWRTLTERTRTTNTATTNSGSALAASVTAEVTWSSAESRRRANTIPSEIPIRLESTAVTTTSVAEFHSRGVNRPTTDWPLTSDVPGSPRRMPVTQCQ